METTTVRASTLDERLLKIAERADEIEGYARPHALRVALVAERLAEKFGFAAHDRSILRQAAFAHDCGELVMNRDYLKAARPLTDEERTDLRRHTIVGEQEAAKQGLNRAAQLLVRWHHEWWNGAGYPDALCGAQIPLAARILRVADAYAALTETRPFRAALAAAAARRHLTEWAGIEFDPRAVKAFLSLEDFE